MSDKEFMSYKLNNMTTAPAYLWQREERKVSRAMLKPIDLSEIEKQVNKIPTYEEYVGGLNE